MKSVIAGEFYKRSRRAARVLVLFVLLYLLISLAIYVEAGRTQEIAWVDAMQMAVKWVYGSVDYSLTSQPLYMVTINLLTPFLIPVIGVFAFVDSLRLRLWLYLRRLLSLRRSQQMILVVGLGRKGLEIVQSALHDGLDVMVVEKDSDNPRIEEAEALGARVWVGDGTSKTDLRIACWCRPRRIWVMTSSTDLNLIILDRINQLFSGATSVSGVAAQNASSVDRLDVYVSIETFAEIPHVITLSLLNLASESYRVHMTHMEEDAAMWLMKKFPMQYVNSRAPRVLVVGLGEQGISILRELYLLCHYSESELVAGLGGSRREDPGWLQEKGIPQLLGVDNKPGSTRRMQHEFSFLQDQANQLLMESPVVVTLPEQDALQWSFDDYLSRIRGSTPFTHVFISIGSDVTNLSMAERIWAWEKAANPSAETIIVPIIYQREAFDWVRLNETRGADQTAVPKPCINPYCVDEAYSVEALRWRDQLEVMAERVNMAYGGKERWHELDQEKRRSNLANARALLTRFPRGLDASASQSVDLEREAECEHRRWNAYVMLAGFSHGKLAQADQKFARVKLRDLARVNANIVRYSELIESVKDFDREMVRQRKDIIAAFFESTSTQ